MKTKMKVGSYLVDDDGDECGVNEIMFSMITSIVVLPVSSCVTQVKAKMNSKQRK